MTRNAKSDKQNAKHKEEGNDIRCSPAQGFRNSGEPLRDENIIEYFRGDETTTTSSADALLVNIDWRKRGIRTKVGMDGEQVDVNNMRDGGVDSRCMGGDGTHLVQQIRCAAAPLVQKKAQLAGTILG